MTILANKTDTKPTPGFCQYCSMPLNQQNRRNGILCLPCFGKRQQEYRRRRIRRQHGVDPDNPTCPDCQEKLPQGYRGLRCKECKSIHLSIQLAAGYRKRMEAMQPETWPETNGGEADNNASEPAPETDQAPHPCPRCGGNTRLPDHDGWTSCWICGQESNIHQQPIGAGSR